MTKNEKEAEIERRKVAFYKQSLEEVKKNDNLNMLPDESDNDDPSVEIISERS